MDITTWLVRRCHQTYRKGNWAGKGVLSALKGVTAEMAHWRPHPEQHTIAEIALHMGYWKDSVTAGLTRKPWTHDKELDWRSPAPTEQGWQEALTELQRAHNRLTKALRGLKPARLMQPLQPRRRLSVADLVVDIATHDSYHSAQIFVLRRLFHTKKI